MEGITFSWDCKTVDVYTSHNELSNVVYNVHWRLNASHADLEDVATIIGTQEISIEDIDPATFIASENLTNEIVTGWVTTALGTERIAEMELSLQNTMQEKLAPTKQTITIQ